VQDPPRRSIYLLTLWQERPASPDEAAVWRISLEDVRTGRRRGFASFEQVLAFLQDRIQTEADAARWRDRPQSRKDPD
jgi:hypothetical protein